MNKIFLSGTYEKEEFKMSNGMIVDFKYITTDLCDKLTIIGCTDDFNDMKTGDKIVVEGVLHFSRQKIDLQNGMEIEENDAFIAVDKAEKIKE